tara:strand:+ start:256 stop:1212 length:957 start_codon:yes stop_codon:yes gene_type:complete
MLTKILVITPINHIDKLEDKLKKIGKLTIKAEPSNEYISKNIHKFEVVYTNPNKSNIFLGEKIIKKASKLKLICTASTGTNHIDVKYAEKNNIKIICLKDDFKTISKISSTAEHAFCLTLASIRNLIPSFNSVKNGNWDYTKFIGRQMNFLTIGIVGYGRLGKMYSDYCKSFQSNILVYDPYKKIRSSKINQVSNLNLLLKKSDIISFHIHINQNTHHLLNKKNIKNLKKNVTLINTSRGEIFDEKEIISFLKKNKNAKLACDVIENEIQDKIKNPLIKFSKKSNQVIISPHIGGMTKEAQNIAYHRVADKLLNFLND